METNQHKREQGSQGLPEGRPWRGAPGPSRGREQGASRWQRERLTASDIMTRDVKSVRGQDTLQDVARIMKDENCGVVPVVDDERRLLGVITDRDIVVRAGTEGRALGELQVQGFMTEDVEAATSDEDLRSIISLMAERQVRRVPIVDRDDRLLGMVSLGDIANRADYDQELQEALQQISAKRSFWRGIWS